MEFLALASLCLAAFGFLEILIAAKLRSDAHAIADDAARDYSDLVVEFERLGKVSAALEADHASCVHSLNTFVELWNDGLNDRAVEVLKAAGFRMAS